MRLDASPAQRTANGDPGEDATNQDPEYRASRRSAGLPRVLISFGRTHASYGEVLAEALRISSEDLTVEAVHPEEFDVAVALLEPNLVIADRIPNRIPRPGVVIGWATLPAEIGMPATFSVSGKTRKLSNPSFEGLLAIVEVVRGSIDGDRG